MHTLTSIHCLSLTRQTLPILAYPRGRRFRYGTPQRDFASGHPRQRPPSPGRALSEGLAALRWHLWWGLAAGVGRLGLKGVAVAATGTVRLLARVAAGGSTRE